MGFHVVYAVVLETAEQAKVDFGDFIGEESWEALGFPGEATPLPASIPPGATLSPPFS